MQLGMVGLGRMGANMVQRLARGGHSCVAFDRDAKVVAEVVKQCEGKAVGANSAQELVSKLTPPRNVWLMIPAGITDRVIADYAPLLQKGDTLIDGGNSYYIDDIRRAKELTAKGINYLDVGTSGGIWGKDRGYCLMIGGPAEAVKRLDAIFKTLAPGKGNAPPTPGRDKLGGTAPDGYLHCGPSGAGHFVKMVHNGIEYGLMAAYAEGLNILKHAGVGQGAATPDAETSPLRDPAAYRYDFNLADLTEVWRRGSVIASWLLDLTAAALASDPGLSRFPGRVSDSGEGRWTTLAAVDESVPAPVISAALFGRFSSQGEADYADKLLSAMRKQFGGHVEKGA